MIICDTHCDRLWMSGFHPDEKPVVTMENLRRGQISLQTCTLFAGTGGPSGHPYAIAMRELEIFRELQEKEHWEQVFSPLDAEEGKVKFMLSLEGGEILEGSVSRLDEFYAEGIRMIALTWNFENEIGYPAKSGDARGIKKAGWDILKKMAAYHVAADVSHLNEAGFWDLLDHHEQPPMASHSCCMALCSHFRNLTDAQIRAMVERGGWIGINFCPEFLREDGKADVRTVCDHVDHICQMGGAKHVGIGSDFDGISSTPVGLETPAQVPNIFEELRRRGYSDDAIADIAGGNFLQYYRRLGWTLPGEG